MSSAAEARQSHRLVPHSGVGGPPTDTVAVHYDVLLANMPAVRRRPDLAKQVEVPA